MDRYRELCERWAGAAGITINGPASHDVRVHNDGFYRRVVAEGSLGLGESYMDGWWDCGQLEELIFRLLRARTGERIGLTWGEWLRVLRARLFNMQSYRGARDVAPHYDLSNEFFEALLDKRVNYSCGYWKDANSLDEAQENKLDLVCRKISLSSEDRVLDIGCGWGGFLKFAGERYRCKMVGITISDNQVGYVRQSCAGLPVEIMKYDYRDLRVADVGTFDKIISIGMFEHVGPKNYGTFMRIAHDLLAEDGLFLLHTIGNNISNVSCNPWIDRYIFRNAVFPSMQQIGRSIEHLFVMEDWHNFGYDYYRTLMSWHDNLSRCGSLNIELPLSRDKFFRMWEFYLASCAAAFRSRNYQLWQIVMSKGNLASSYASVR